jgi:GNAT superfamily N-acetyltransferase
MISRAAPETHEVLTAISFRAKAHWRYPAAYFRLWKNELTITPEYIERHRVYVYREAKGISGYYSLVHLSSDLQTAGITLAAGWWLDHMFVLPERMGQGIGRKLFDHCLDLLMAAGGCCLHILADPHALDFYLKMGCRLIGHQSSTIPGRTTPYLFYGSSVRQSPLLVGTDQEAERTR